ncbi:MAG TPA: DNA polymerase III subunit [Polyangiaceae bacterium]|nr:DNA polymerase III subunit [Polyangiaceae bacterium]
MSFSHILGQATALQTLERALQSGRVHHAYRFEGPEGVGKEKTAFALARALVCTGGDPLGCERCRACQRALTLAEGEPRVPVHPDVVLLERGLYPSSVIGAPEATGISVEQVRRIVLGRAGFPPHEGRALVFIIRAAEELTPQAANALLKTLEEPAARVHFVLLTSRPNRLLDTIRSRTLAVRFGALSEEILRSIAEAHGLDPSVAVLAEGSAARALELGDPDSLQQKQEFTEAARSAITAPDLASGLGLADTRGTDRDGLRAQLNHLAHSLATESRGLVAERADRAELLARRHQVVLTALTELERNVQPSFVVESMLYRLRHA